MKFPTKYVHTKYSNNKVCECNYGDFVDDD